MNPPFFDRIQNLCRTCLTPQPDDRIIYQFPTVDRLKDVESDQSESLQPPLIPRLYHHYSRYVTPVKDSFKATTTNHRTKSILSLYQEPLNGNRSMTIDESIFHQMTIIQMLSLAIPQLCIPTEEEDILPQHLCEECLKKLWKVLRFQRMCLKADEQLKCMLKQQETLQESSTDHNQILEPEVDDPAKEKNVPSANSSNDESVSTMTLRMVNDINGLNVQLCETVLQSDTYKEKLKSKESQEDDSSLTRISDQSPLHESLNSVNDGKYCSSVDSSSSKEIEFREVEELEDITEQFQHKTICDIKQTDNISRKKKNLFVCDECGSHLMTRRSLKRHLEIHRRPQSKELANGRRRNTFHRVMHQCNFCHKIFQQSSTLKDHIRVHTGEQPFLCSECGKAFKSLSNMKQHLLRHNNDRRYECPDCPKKFPCLSDLASHKAVHYKNKAHICDVCGAGFIKPYQLKKHKMYHNGDKPHKCEYCEMRFVLADQMRRHMRTHTGEKPYKCKYCTRAFAQSNDLVKHLRGHLGENVYKCEMCPQSFRLIKELRVHFTVHKNEDSETRARNLAALLEDEKRLQIKFGINQTD